MDAARTLRERLKEAFAVHVLARAGEALSVGACAGAVLVAVARFSPRGGTLTDDAHGQLVAVAVLTGLAAAGSWALDHAPRRARHLRRVDRRLELDGALVTAVDAGRAAPAEAVHVDTVHDGAVQVGAVYPGAVPVRAAIAEALSRRVLALAPRTSLWRASLPASPVAVVALLAAVAAIVASREFAPAREAAPRDALGHARAVAASAANDLRRVAQRDTAEISNAISSAAREDLTRLARELENFARRPPTSTADSAALEALARDAAALARSSALAPARQGEGPDAAAARARARNSLGEVASALATAGRAGADPERGAPELASDPERGSTPGGGPGAGANRTGASEAGDPGPSRTAGSSAGAPFGATLTAGSPDGRMVAPRTDGIVPVAVSAPLDNPGIERGVAAMRWWPTEHDAVVERWVESRRPR